MKDISTIAHHPISEQLVGVLCERTQNPHPLFFRIHVAYYFSMVASMMRCQLATLDKGSLPINLFALNLATSGAGKGYSTNIMEEQVLAPFFQRFTQETFPLAAEMNLPVLASERAIRKNTDPDEELLRVQKEFDSQGALVTIFNSGTTPAVSQARHKLLMAKAGSLNLQIDEIGSNLVGNAEVLDMYLELYDVGRIKNKMTKNTSENIRAEEIIGRTPTNMMLFGEPLRLMDGDKTEEHLYIMLQTGYARRCWFSYLKDHTPPLDLTPEQLLDQRTSLTTNAFLDSLADKFSSLADISYLNKNVSLNRDVTLLFIEYEQQNARKARAMREHEDLRKKELIHRHFKAMKLAGAYAFVDGNTEVTMENAYQAIKLAEESGAAFEMLLTRDRPYVKLAKYIADIGREVTQADLVEDLPFYKGSVSAKQEMLQLAIAHGYQNNILIKKMFNDGIEFLRGETLKVLNLNEIIVSYSQDIAVDYIPEVVPWGRLHELTQATGMHWANHHFKEGHRSEEDAIPGFNIIVVDVDGEATVQQAQLFLKEYTYLIYTTKRHTDTEHRFRIVMPIAYELKMEAKEYKEFMANLFTWLPFEVDAQTNQRARKWLSHDGEYVYNEAEILDPLPFIPKTTKNEERKRLLNDQASLDALERWVLNNSGDGNRNNMLLKYAMLLVDSGFDFESVRQKVTGLNYKMPDKLDDSEIMGTVMITAAKAIAKKAA